MREKIANVNQAHDEILTIGDRIADNVAALVGSWSFVIGMSALLTLWIILNSIAVINHWDEYPFILLNLCLSFLAGYTGPFIMMSQNRQSAKDRLTAEADYQTNLAAKSEVEIILTHLDKQDQQILEIVQRLDAVLSQGRISQ